MNYGKKKFQLKTQCNLQRCVRYGHLTSRSKTDAENASKRIKEEFPNISLGTVYRNIALFKDEGKVSVICNVNGEERIDGNTEPHPHFVCNKCKAVIDVEDNQNADDLESQLAEEGFKVENRFVIYYGICPKCSAEVH